MIETGLIAFKFLGTGVLGWTLGKFCDQSVLVGKTELQKRLKNKGLDPNHDIERAVLTAHYKALQFIIEHAFSQEDDNRVETYSSRLKTVRDIKFPEIFKSIQEPELDNLPSALVENWQIVIPTSFEPAANLNEVHKLMPDAYLKQAEADLLKLAGWSDIEEQALKQWIADPEFGWVPSFSACLREQIKINGDFRNIFFATNQQRQMESLARIETQLKTHLAPNEALAQAMSRVEESLGRIESGVDEANERLERIEEKIDQTVKRQHYETEVGHQYPNYLAKLLIKSDVDEALWEDEITTALTRYVKGKTQLEEQTNLTDYLETKRAEALELYEQAKLDEGEAILRELVKTITLEKLESAARDHARLLIDQTSFALARLDYRHALDLYEQAANVILPVERHQSILWLLQGASLGYERGRLFENNLLRQTVKLLHSARSKITYENETPTDEFKELWAIVHNYLGCVYHVLGMRVDKDALDKAIQAFTSVLTVFTYKKSPIQWAQTQFNLGIVFDLKGRNGTVDDIHNAIIAYEKAMSVYKIDANPREWVTTNGNLQKAREKLRKRQSH